MSIIDFRFNIWKEQIVRFADGTYFVIRSPPAVRPPLIVYGAGAGARSTFRLGGGPALIQRLQTRGKILDAKNQDHKHEIRRRRVNANTSEIKSIVVDLTPLRTVISKPIVCRCFQVAPGGISFRGRACLRLVQKRFFFFLI